MCLKVLNFKVVGSWLVLGVKFRVFFKDEAFGKELKKFNIEMLKNLLQSSKWLFINDVWLKEFSRNSDTLGFCLI